MHKYIFKQQILLAPQTMIGREIDGATQASQGTGKVNDCKQAMVKAAILPAGLTVKNAQLFLSTLDVTHSNPSAHATDCPPLNIGQVRHAAQLLRKDDTAVMHARPRGKISHFSQ